MKAMLLTGHGGVNRLVYGDAPDPVAGPGDVVVDIRAASINAADYKMRLGGSHYAAGNLKFPHILGRDFSGVVSALGEGVTDLRIGDEVFGVLEPGREAAYADAGVDVQLVAVDPEGPFERAEQRPGQVRRAVSTDRSSRSRKCRRLASPVSESCAA